jgi:hydroxymethylbilane synthase
MSEKFVIGTRGSELALWQANFVKASLEEFFPEHIFEIKIVHTTGDQVVDVALSKIGDKGLFTREIESELLEGAIDLAVHSLKDLQTEQPEGLTIGAVCKRETPNDVLISKTGPTIDDLPEGATVATGSLRRRSQLLHYRSDLKIAEIRGNVPTRLRKFDGSDLDGIVLAHAGVRRLGLEDRVSQIIPFEVMLPAVGQGAVAVEIRSTDVRTAVVVERLDDVVTRVSISAERAFLRRLEGGCQVPIGAYATLNGRQLTLEGRVGSFDGTVLFRESITGAASDAESLGVDLANSLIEKGVQELLDSIRSETESSTKAAI